MEDSIVVQREKMFKDTIFALTELKEDYRKSLDIMTNCYADLMKENIKLKRKAEMWDTLSEKISKFYVNTEDEYDEDKPQNSGDLVDIGEIAAIAFGWL